MSWLLDKPTKAGWCVDASALLWMRFHLLCMNRRLSPLCSEAALGCAHKTNPLANGRIDADYIFKPKDIDVDGPRCVWE